VATLSETLLFVRDLCGKYRSGNGRKTYVETMRTDEGRPGPGRGARSGGENEDPPADILADIDLCRPDLYLADVLAYFLAAPNTESDGGGCEALVESLSGDAQVPGEVFQGRAGPAQPAEDQGLQEGAAVEGADASNKAGGVGQPVGAAGEEEVQNGG